MKIKNKIAKLISIISIVIILCLGYGSTFVSHAQTNAGSKLGDIDEDNEITINDIAIMKLILLGKRKIEYKGYTFEPIEPTHEKVTYTRINMTKERMIEYRTYGAGYQWPV